MVLETNQFKKITETKTHLKQKVMIEQLKKSDSNVLAIEVIDGFTETDEKFCQKLFDEKLKQGYDKLNVLIKLDEMKLSKTNTKAFFEDILFTIRNYKKLGHLAIVGHSNILKAAVPIDGWFFERLNNGGEERYFDKSNLNEAFKFVNQ